MPKSRSKAVKAHTWFTTGLLINTSAFECAFENSIAEH